MIKTGCCGFPKGMQHYFEEFRLVELQTTFYKLPRLETARKWRAMAPRNFEFTLKVSQLITHEPRSPTYRRSGIKIPEDKEAVYGSFRPTEEVFSAWEGTKEICEALESRIVVFQCPASFKPTAEHVKNMKEFFSSIRRRTVRDRSLELVWEPRGRWDARVIGELCEDLKLSHCTDPFAADVVHATQIAYFRLHGSPPGKRGITTITRRKT